MRLTVCCGCGCSGGNRVAIPGRDACLCCAGGCGGPEYGGPEYGGPEYGGPEYGGPEYGGPEYGGPEYGGPEYGGPEYGGPEYGGPEYGGPEYGGRQAALRPTGWHPDVPDPRDHRYALDAEDHDLPASFDLRDTTDRRADVPVYHQGRYQSCTSHALAAALQYLDTGLPSDFRPSRMFLYWNERVEEGDTVCNSTVGIRSSLRVANRFGVCDESLWPYRASTMCSEPPQAVYERTRLRRRIGYARVPRPGTHPDNLGVAGIQHTLAVRQQPVLFGFSVLEGFLEAGRNGGRAPQPRDSERVLFGHAALAVGYAEGADGPEFICQNSWGIRWGQDGFFHLPAAYFASRRLSADVWTVWRRQPRQGTNQTSAAGAAR